MRVRWKWARENVLFEFNKTRRDFLSRFIFPVVTGVSSIITLLDFASSQLSPIIRYRNFGDSSWKGDPDILR